MVDISKYYSLWEERTTNHWALPYGNLCGHVSLIFSVFCSKIGTLDLGHGWQWFDGRTTQWRWFHGMRVPSVRVIHATEQVSSHKKTRKIDEVYQRGRVVLVWWSLSWTPWYVVEVLRSQNLEVFHTQCGSWMTLVGDTGVGSPIRPWSWGGGELHDLPRDLVPKLSYLFLWSITTCQGTKMWSPSRESPSCSWSEVVRTLNFSIF